MTELQAYTYTHTNNARACRPGLQVNTMYIECPYLRIILGCFRGFGVCMCKLCGTRLKVALQTREVHSTSLVPIGTDPPEFHTTSFPFEFRCGTSAHGWRATGVASLHDLCWARALRVGAQFGVARTHNNAIL